MFLNAIIPNTSPLFQAQDYLPAESRACTPNRMKGLWHQMLLLSHTSAMGLTRLPMLIHSLCLSEHFWNSVCCCKMQIEIVEEHIAMEILIKAFISDSHYHREFPACWEWLKCLFPICKLYPSYVWILKVSPFLVIFSPELSFIAPAPRNCCAYFFILLFYFLLYINLMRSHGPCTSIFWS